jgi:hypothetical protein
METRAAMKKRAFDNMTGVDTKTSTNATTRAPAMKKRAFDKTGVDTKTSTCTSSNMSAIDMSILYSDLVEEQGLDLAQFLEIDNCEYAKFLDEFITTFFRCDEAILIDDM